VCGERRTRDVVRVADAMIFIIFSRAVAKAGVRGLRVGQLDGVVAEPEAKGG
jgi:hypothetical protein